MLKFRSNAPVKKLRNLSLSLKRGRRALGSFKLVSRCSENINSKEQRAAITRHGIVRIIAYYKEILKEKNTYLSRQISVPGFVKLCIIALLLYIGDDDPDNQPTVHEEEPSP
jgi:hypothetical protein